MDILLVTEPSEQRHGLRQRAEIAISTLKRVFGLGETLATTLVGPPGSRPRKQPTPTPLWSTGSWDALKGASRSCGHENLTTHIQQREMMVYLVMDAEQVRSLRKQKRMSQRQLEEVSGVSSAHSGDLLGNG